MRVPGGEGFELYTTLKAFFKISPHPNPLPKGEGTIYFIISEYDLKRKILTGKELSYNSLLIQL
jgi:hypothetical protein